MRIHHRLAALAFAAALLTGACSSGDAESADPAPTTTEATTETTAAEPVDVDDSDGDVEEFCSIFGELADRRNASETEGEPQNDGEFTVMADTVAQIAAVAPDEIADEAAAYVEMVDLRAELSAENGGVGREDLPADARAEFIAENGDLQQEVNELIDYARTTCDGF